MQKIGSEKSSDVIYRLNFSMLGLFLVVKSANSDRPPIGFCNESLLGSKYAGAFKV
jgi:hypothetical protein